MKETIEPSACNFNVTAHIRRFAPLGEGTDDGARNTTPISLTYSAHMDDKNKTLLTSIALAEYGTHGELLSHIYEKGFVQEHEQDKTGLGFHNIYTPNNQAISYLMFGWQRIVALPDKPPIMGACLTRERSDIPPEVALCAEMGTRAAMLSIIDRDRIYDEIGDEFDDETGDYTHQTSRVWTPRQLYEVPTESIQRS